MSMTTASNQPNFYAYQNSQAGMRALSVLRRRYEPGRCHELFPDEVPSRDGILLLVPLTNHMVVGDKKVKVSLWISQSVRIGPCDLEGLVPEELFGHPFTVLLRDSVRDRIWQRPNWEEHLDKVIRQYLQWMKGQNFNSLPDGKMPLAGSEERQKALEWLRMAQSVIGGRTITPPPTGPLPNYRLNPPTQPVTAAWNAD